MARLAAGNRVVHGLWIGPSLSRLELLTLHSFTRHGHEFHLWLYDGLAQELPRGVVIRDAAEIFPRRAIFRNAAADPGSGVGPGSLGAFSDLFRYKLLYEHGGIWVDMDVTCLRPFDIAAPYLFRAHEIGVVGNIMKCPRRSPVMRDTLAAALAAVTPDTAWMTANALLSTQVVAHGLTRFIVADFCNRDDWHREVAPMVRGFVQPEDGWGAIHWLREYWRGLADGRIAETRPGAARLPVPDKDTPPAGGLLEELYRLYGLIDPFVQSVAAARPAPPEVRVATPAPALQLNMLVPRLIRGGAERIALDLADAFPDGGATLYVLNKAARQYNVPAVLKTTVRFLDAPDNEAKLRAVALSVLDSGARLLFTHMIPARELHMLWDWGVLTVPVIHNASPSWLDDVRAYAHDHVPFVVAVSHAVAEELRGRGCEKPVILLRHEVRRGYEAARMTRDRRMIREQYGIGPQTLLIGMVGQFKPQKAYTRAVRVLAAMLHICDARLMILGGWDTATGRVAYEAACRLAVELGVIANVLTPGDIGVTDPFYAAFDVFLNTSVHEGLSIALLEAAAAGCPVVAADAGGNREASPEGGALVADGADIDAYARGIFGFLRQQPRMLPPPPALPRLVPLHWALLARFGAARPAAQPAARGTMFVTANLHVGGAQRSLVNLLTALPARTKAVLAVLGGATQPEFSEQLAAARIPLAALDGLDRVDQVSRLLACAERLQVRNICFWNVAPEVKLLLSSILRLRDIRLIDVSPGPMLFDALAAAAAFQHRLGFDAAAYFSRLDVFVAKYADGVPPAEFGIPAEKIHVIPNGVFTPPGLIRLPPAAALLPPSFDPALAIGTCCRLVPDKRLDFLIAMMRELAALVPGVTLTIAGGPEGGDGGYYDGVLARVAEAGLEGIRLVGSQVDVNRLLAQFRVFVMVSNRQGCPNASLEAMAMGLPVVAARGGGVAEQVSDGVTGFLVDTPAEMAARVTALLRAPARRAKMGAAGRARALSAFSMQRMVAAYGQMLDGV